MEKSYSQQTIACGYNTQQSVANEPLYFDNHMRMIAKCVVILFVMQVFTVDWSTSRHVSLQHLTENFPGKSPILDLSQKNHKRGRRCLGTALTLLWPQVVGPVEQGVIVERDFDEVPKTVLEYRLDLLRKKAEEEEHNRLLVRDYMKRLTEAQDDFYGYASSLMSDYT